MKPPRSLAGSKEEGKGYLGSEGLGKGTLSLEGAFLLCNQLLSGPVSLCFKQDSPRRTEATGLWPSQERTGVVVLSLRFSGH